MRDQLGREILSLLGGIQKTIRVRILGESDIKKVSLVVLWLEHHTPNGGPTLLPGGGTRSHRLQIETPHAARKIKGLECCKDGPGTAKCIHICKIKRKPSWGQARNAMGVLVPLGLFRPHCVLLSGHCGKHLKRYKHALTFKMSIFSEIYSKHQNVYTSTRKCFKRFLLGNKIY